MKSLLKQEQSVIELKDSSMNELKDEIKRLKSVIMVREEANKTLQGQLSELNRTHLVLSQSEIQNYYQSQNEIKSLQEKIKDLTQSVDKHVELLRRGEEEAAGIKQKLDETLSQNISLREEAANKAQELINEELYSKALKKDISELKKEMKLLLEKLESTQTICINKNNEIEEIKKEIAKLKAVIEAEGNKTKEEKKRRLVADEAVRSLRSRVGFLLEQLQQALSLTVSWQEQKLLLKSQVCSLHRANLEIRRKIVNLQRQYLARTIYS
eukprot:gene4940-6294_t